MTRLKLFSRSSHRRFGGRGAQRGTGRAGSPPMSPRHAVRRSPRRLWWTVAGGNAVLGAAVLTAVVLSTAPGAAVDRTPSASIATATSGPEPTAGAARARAEIADGWAASTTAE